MRTKEHDYSFLAGKICQTHDGERVLVEDVGDSEIGQRAIVRLIEGPNQGTRRVYFPARLQPLLLQSAANSH